MDSPVSGFRSPVSLKIVFVGHVDHGKSTVIGRILEQTGSLPEGKIEALRASCAAQGRRFEYAFVLDALHKKQNTLDQNEQQLTSDIANKESPVNLAARAAQLGLVPSRTPAFLLLPDGTKLEMPGPGNSK